MVFLIHTELRYTVNHTSDLSLLVGTRLSKSVTSFRQGKFLKGRSEEKDINLQNVLFHRSHKNSTLYIRYNIIEYTNSMGVPNLRNLTDPQNRPWHLVLVCDAMQMFRCIRNAWRLHINGRSLEIYQTTWHHNPENGNNYSICQ